MSSSFDRAARNGDPGSSPDAVGVPRGALTTLRAGVISFLLFFNVLAALPTPGEPTPERLERPFERAEVQRWTALLVALGIDTEPAAVARGYLTFSRWVVAARAVALAPISGLMALTHTHQGWRLFGTPDRAVSALRITARSPGGDEVLYESGDPDRRWRAGFLEYRRVRAQYNPSRRGPPPTYAAFAKRAGEEVLSSVPGVTRATVALVERRVRLPHDPSHPSGVAGDERVEHALEVVRPEP